jgi:NADPH:quinone reductase-like Zn-dependent oxidoreductase
MPSAPGRRGAATVIDYAADPAWGETAYRASDGGVDLVIENGGVATFDQSVAAARIGGAIGVIGVITGDRGNVDMGAMRRKSLHVFGVTVGSAATLAAVDRAMATWAIRPVIDRVFAFDEARQAFDHLLGGAQLGKVVIRV